MTRQQNMIGAFRVVTSKREYLVTLERLNNDRNGNPRYKAVIVFTEPDSDSFYNAVYTFTGHYCGEQNESDYIVTYYERTHE